MKKLIKIVVADERRSLREIFLNPDKIFSIEKVDNPMKQSSGYGYGTPEKIEILSNYSYKYLIHFDDNKENSPIHVCLDYRNWKDLIKINQDFEHWLQENCYTANHLTEKEGEKIKWT